jgi:hypothetical protein
MQTRRRDHSPPIADPVDIPDIFASDFDVHDWEDWVRLLCWVDTIEATDGDGETQEGRRKAAAIVIPRSSIPNLVRVLRHSAQQPKSRRHS